MTRVEKIYRVADYQIPVLRAVNLKVQSGETIAITGVSGVGKSTLLFVMGLLSPSDGGEIVLFNERVSFLDSRQAALIRRKHIGFVFQDFFLLPRMSAVENVMLPLVQNYIPKPSARMQAERMLCRVGLGERLGHLPSELSGGEKQRVAIARAFIHHPRLVLADEPTGNLDSSNTRNIIQLISELLDNRSALVLATHDPELASRCKTVYRMWDGYLEKV